MMLDLTNSIGASWTVEVTQWLVPEAIIGLNSQWYSGTMPTQIAAVEMAWTVVIWYNKVVAGAIGNAVQHIAAGFKPIHIPIPMIL